MSSCYLQYYFIKYLSNWLKFQPLMLEWPMAKNVEEFFTAFLTEEFVRKRFIRTLRLAWEPWSFRNASWGSFLTKLHTHPNQDANLFRVHLTVDTRNLFEELFVRWKATSRRLLLLSLRLRPLTRFPKCCHWTCLSCWALTQVTRTVSRSSDFDWNDWGTDCCLSEAWSWCHYWRCMSKLSRSFS